MRSSAACTALNQRWTIRLLNQISASVGCEDALCWLEQFYPKVKRCEEKKWRKEVKKRSGTRTFTWKHISSSLTWTTDSHTEWRGEGLIQFIRGLEFALYFKYDLLTGWSFSCSCQSSLFTGVFTAVSSTYCSQGRTELWRKEKQLFMLRAEGGFYFLWFHKRCPHIHTSGASEQRKLHTF